MTCPCGSGLPAKRGNVGQVYCDRCRSSPRSVGKLRTMMDADTDVIRRMAVVRRRIEEINDAKQGEA